MNVLQLLKLTGILFLKCKYFGVFLKTTFKDGSVVLLELAPNKWGDDKQRTIWHGESYIRKDRKLNEQLGLKQEIYYE